MVYIMVDIESDGPIPWLRSAVAAPSLRHATEKENK